VNNKPMLDKNKPNQNRQIIVTEKDLPLSCPPTVPNQATWDLHPKIYLPIKEQKLITCPYCGIEYVFAETNKP
jgi:uncharacterized Zn-finger protein